MTSERAPGAGVAAADGGVATAHGGVESCGGGETVDSEQQVQYMPHGPWVPG